MSAKSQAHDELKMLGRYGKSFRFAGALLSRDELERCAVLYAFCRKVDDLVDEASDPESARRRLEELRDSVASGDTRCPIAGRFLRLQSECGIDPEVVGQFLQGVESDLREARVADVGGLLRYAYQVAGTVGYMMCRLFRVTDSRAYPYALDLGIAMQLTNICRDVLEDARLGRVYLPETLMPQAVTAEGLVDDQAGCRQAAERAVVHLLGMADTYYRSAEQGLHYLPARARLAILVAARVYEAIGQRILRDPARIWRERTHVSLGGKLAVAARALVWALKNPLFCLGDLSVHDKWLHSALEGLPGANRRGVA